MTSSRLYLDRNLSCVYWCPALLYDGIEADVSDMEMCVRKLFTRVEEHELLRLKQKLLQDDWDILCGILESLADEMIARVADSPLLLERQMHVLCGEYMGQLKTA